MDLRRLTPAVLLTLALTASGALVSCGSTSAVPTPPPTGGPIRTVFLIVMENHNWSSIKGSLFAPYINHTLLPIASHAENYYNPPNNHPSLPNYLWLEAGANFGVRADVLPSQAMQSTNLHLAALLDRASISWRAYEENINGQSCPLNSHFPYVPRHNPFVYFRDIADHPSYCIAHERPYSQLASDLQHNRVARYNFITPNVCHDMHDPCPPYFVSTKNGDSWLSHAVPPILRSAAYRDSGALFITWDEADDGDGPIGMIALSPLAKGHGYASHVHYTHSSTLRTLEEIFHVRPWLGDAAHATDLRDLFRRFP